jgi:hypothetical protein
MPNPDNEPQLPKNQSPIIDERSGLVARDWYRFFLNLLNKANQGGGGGGTGTVTSVNVSGGSTGLTTSGGPVTTSGTITLAGTLDVDNGGTGSTTAAGARTNLSVPSTTGSGASGTWAIDITGNAANVTGTVAIANGGTGQTTAAAAITALTGTQTSGQYLRSDGTNAALGAIQAADVPTLNQNTTGQAGSVANALTAGTGISYSAGTTYDGSAAITISNSAPDQTVVLTDGTGISTSGTYPNFTITNTAPDQTVVLTAGTGISTSGTYPNFTITNTSPSLGGDVVGPSSATDNAVARYDTTTGKLIQNSLVLIGDTGNVTGVNALTAESLTVNDNTTLGFSNTDTLDVRARIISDLEPNANNAKDIGTNGRNWRDGFFGRNLSTVNLEVTGTTSFDGQQGTSGQVLTSAGTGATPTWTTPTTGTVTSVSGTGTVNGISLSGTVTSSGNLTLGGALTGVDLTSQVTGTLPIANGGTGQTTASAAFNALSPVTSTGDLIIGNGTNSSTRLPIGANNYVLTSNGTTATWALSSGSGATISNDTSTTTNLYPTFAAATSGALANIYTSDPKYLYKPSTGELTSEHFVAGNGIFVNSLTIDTSYTIVAGTSGMSAGPVTVASGITVTVASGSRWVVV